MISSSRETLVLTGYLYLTPWFLFFPFLFFPSKYGQSSYTCAMMMSNRIRPQRAFVQNTNSCLVISKQTGKWNGPTLLFVGIYGSREISLVICVAHNTVLTLMPLLSAAGSDWMFRRLAWRLILCWTTIFLNASECAWDIIRKELRASESVTRM